MFELSATRCSFRKHLEKVSDEEDGRRERRKKEKKVRERNWTKGWKGEEACKLACGGDSI